MPAYLGIACQYLFKDHPRDLFGWMELGAEGAQYLGRLSGKALSVAKNISKTAALLQMGYDLPRAFHNIRVLSEKIRGYKTIPTKDSIILPLWVEISQGVGHIAFLTNFGRRHILEERSSPLIKLVEAVAELIKASYDFYIFIHEWKKKPIELDEKEVETIPDQEFSSNPLKMSTLSWDIQSVAQLSHKTSYFVLTVLSLISIYKGTDNQYPLLSLMCTSICLSSDFIVYCQIPYKTDSYTVLNEYESTS